MLAEAIAGDIASRQVVEKLKMYVLCHPEERRIFYYHTVEILHYVQNDSKRDFFNNL